MYGKYLQSGTLPLLFLLPALVSGKAFAESYHSTLSIFHSSRNHSNYDASITGLGGAYYWTPVKASNPLAESAFLSKASGIGFSFAQVSYDFGSLNVDGPGKELSLSYVFRKQGLHIGMYSRTESLTGMGIETDSDFSSVSIGKFIADKILVSLSYGTGTDTFTGNPDIDISSTGISFKRLVNNINFEAGIASENYDDGTTVQTNNEIGFSTDFYLDSSFSIGVAYSNNSGDNKGTEGTTFSLDTKKFVNNFTSIDISYDSFSANAGRYSSTFSFTLSSRF